MKDDSFLYSTLAFAGVLPFLACALLPLAGIASVSPLGQLDELANSYGLAIVGFLAGIHWATQLLGQNRRSGNLMIASNVVFLATWFMFVLGDTAWSLATQVFALNAILLIDWSLKKAAVISGHYFRTRVVATGLASAALGLMVVS